MFRYALRSYNCFFLGVICFFPPLRHTVMIGTKFSLEALLGTKCSKEEFFSEYWQKRPLHVKRAEEEAYWEKKETAEVNGGGKGEEDAFEPRRLPPVEHLCSIVDMEELWQNAGNNGSADSLLIFRDGKQQPISNPFFAFANDYSVVVNKGDRFCAAIYRICKTLEAQQFPFAFCNVYLTPPNAQTVPAHSDDREVLLLQLEGKKRWTVYDRPPVHLPYKDEEFGKGKIKLLGQSEDGEEISAEDATRDVLLSTEVEPGDLLYLPRGFVHEAKTVGSMSLHLTIALQSSDWDYAKTVSGQVNDILRSSAMKEARACLPHELLPIPSYASGGYEAISNDAMRRGASQYKAVVQQLIQQLQQSVDDPAVGFFPLVGDFHARLADIQKERDNFVREHLMMSLNSLRLTTLLIWNPVIVMVGRERLGADNAGNKPTLPYLLAFKRKGTEDLMRLGATEMTAKMIVTLYDHHREAPMEVSDFPFMSSDLAKLCLANLLVKNTCCIRVT